MVTVVFSAPTNSNIGSGEFQGSGSSFGNNKFGEWNNNGQGQRIGQSDNNNIRLQGFFQFYGFGELQQPSQFENNRPFQGGFQGGNVGPSSGNQGKPSQGVKPEGHNKPGGQGHFPTGMPHTGMPGHFGGMTGQPGFFGQGNGGNRNQRTTTTTTASPSSKHQFQLL